MPLEYPTMPPVSDTTSVSCALVRLSPVTLLRLMSLSSSPPTVMSVFTSASFLQPETVPQLHPTMPPVKRFPVTVPVTWQFFTVPRFSPTMPPT